jgi:Tfp pilus assembly protein PilN
MRRLAIDFVPHRGAGTWLGGAILLAGVAAAVLVAEHHQALEARRDQLELGLSAASRTKPGTGSASQAPASREEAQRRNAARRSVVRALGRPWDALFTDVESAAHAQVGLLALEPDVRRGEVRLSGEARDAQALAEYMAALEGTPALERVNLTQHEMVAEGGHPALRFILVGAWRGAR